MDEEYTKSEGQPPVGIEPYYVWESNRIKDILAAMERYSLHGLPIPLAWITELQGHLTFSE